MNWNSSCSELLETNQIKTCAFSCCSLILYLIIKSSHSIPFHQLFVTNMIIIIINIKVCFQFAFIFMIYQIQGDVVDIFATSQLMIFSYIQCSMVLLPVGIVFLAKCCRHVKYRVSRHRDFWLLIIFYCFFLSPFCKMNTS